MADWQVITGDCLEVMRGMDADSVDTIITDPPYGLSFMGKEWDHGVPGVHFWQEALRVAKPGAMMLAFGGTRTFHRLAVAIEDAGWQLRDTMMYLYGSGFPKSHDISKAIDKAAGEVREVVGPKIRPDGKAMIDARPNGFDGSHDGWDRPWKHDRAAIERQASITAPATDAARQWDGWGTALKPAWEPIIVAMKPLDGTFAANALRHGVAGLWVDGGRIPANGDTSNARANKSGEEQTTGYDGGWKPIERQWQGNSGRWPANVITDGSDEVLAGFPVTTSGARTGASSAGDNRIFKLHGGACETSTGSAARFFYCAKASRAERNAGLEEPNGHPCVKPLSLMRHLARLTKTPTGGVVLDPFAGSGSTGCAAVMEGRGFIGIEIDEGYATIARARIAKAAEQAQQLALPDMEQ